MLGHVFTAVIALAIGAILVMLFRRPAAARGVASAPSSPKKPATAIGGPLAQWAQDHLERRQEMAKAEAQIKELIAGNPHGPT